MPMVVVAVTVLILALLVKVSRLLAKATVAFLTCLWHTGGDIGTNVADRLPPEDRVWAPTVQWVVQVMVMLIGVLVALCVLAQVF